MNIRILATASAGLASICVIVTVILWGKLRSEQERTATLQSQPVVPVIAQSPAIPLSTALAEAPVPVAELDSTVVAPQGRSDLSALRSRPDVYAALATNPNVIVKQLLDDPEYRGARLAMLRATIMQTYPGITEELRLTKEEADRLFEILAEAELSRSSATGAVMTRLDTQDIAAELRRMQQDLQRQQAESLRALLGDARYTQWQYYQPTRDIRMQAGEFAMALSDAGAPMTSTQITSLVNAMLGEQKSLQQETVALARTINPDVPQTQMQAQEAVKQRQAESRQRLFDTSATFLSRQQLQMLRAHVEQQEAMSAAVARAREQARQTLPRP
jgi:hypothetical protein